MEEGSKTKMSSDYKGSKGPIIGTRHIQILLLSLGHSIALSTKSSFSVAIVAMTDNTTTSNPNVPTYPWTNTSVIVSSILWSGIPINLVAGYLGKRYGPKWFIVCTKFINSIIFMLIPQAAQTGGSGAVIACRLCQGICLGFSYPLTAVVHGRWIPPEERSRLGFIGTAITTCLGTLSSTVSGYIAASALGWPWIFYTFGIFAFPWSLLYMIFGSQSPESHGNIDPNERKYLAETLRETSDEKGAVPWRKMFTAKPFWAIIIGQIGLYVIFIMISTETNIFLANVMKFDIKQNAVLSSIPNVVGMLSGTVFSILSDLSIKRKLLSIVNARRLFHLTGVTGMSISLIMMTYIPVEHKLWSIVLLSFGKACLMVCSVCGIGINILDVSPKYAGITMGVAQTISQSISLFGPLMVQWVCTDLSDAIQWRTVFLTTACVSIGTGIFFGAFASGERQNWDDESEQESQMAVKRRKSSILSISAGVLS